MALCVVSGILKDVSETAVSGATVAAKVISPYFTTTIQIVPLEITTATDTSGAWSLSLSQGASCVVTIAYPPNTVDTARLYTYSIIVPNTSTANFSSLATES